ncbi:unnamed protein product [Caenorhabditis sp. 36 PRJEB53466]|nr:unnamed protein product [Caenorhabditis sp. 36 PRJEB53466]
MWKIQWSEDLVKKADALKCSELKPGTDYRYLMVKDGGELRNVAELREIVDFHRTKPMAERERIFEMSEESNAGLREAALPAQSRIGCVEKKCELPVLCLFGPHGSMKKTAAQTKRGAAGSECGHGTKEDGLCSDSGNIPFFVSIAVLFMSIVLNF